MSSNRSAFLTSHLFEIKKKTSIFLLKGKPLVKVAHWVLKTKRDWVTSCHSKVSNDFFLEHCSLLEHNTTPYIWFWVLPRNWFALKFSKRNWSVERTSWLDFDIDGDGYRPRQYSTQKHLERWNKTGLFERFGITIQRTSSQTSKDNFRPSLKHKIELNFCRNASNS